MNTPAPGKTAEYILPLRWPDDSDLPDLATYLRRLTGWIAVTVVDGSAPNVFEHHRRVFPPNVRHLRPVPESGSAGPGRAGAGNGKVAGVMTGVRVSTADLLVIADDDVRYTRESLAAVVQHLSSADVVRPQNYYDPLPWQARWDTARTLINRAWSADLPGTLALRRSTLVAAQGYDGVLFENLELIRTIKAAGGCEKVVPDLFVARRPPKARHFLKQRVRQAYDDFAQPRRLGVELALLPAILAAARLPARLRVAAFLTLAAASAVAAEVGRRRNRGTSVFPFTTVWFAPLWTLERAVCVWIALGFRLAGGMPYAGTRLKTAAHSEAELRLRHSRLAGTRQQDCMEFHSNPEQEQK
ncbi:glycosyltransferase family 2 protein [Arthrobacter sp. OY3WO11]|uniref:glycosyltransferase n=1 Tax=Arthrobacter sp. OY3WO11 TaxID=1835723 RepID=UPI000AA1ACAD|nr:glycosyltransferase family 2 protein [Arthrobacter sp. OY3WO11]